MTLSSNYVLGQAGLGMLLTLCIVILDSWVWSFDLSHAICSRQWRPSEFWGRGGPTLGYSSVSACCSAMPPRRSAHLRNVPVAPASVLESLASRRKRLCPDSSQEAESNPDVMEQSGGAITLRCPSAPPARSPRGALRQSSREYRHQGGHACGAQRSAGFLRRSLAGPPRSWC